MSLLAVSISVNSILYAVLIVGGVGLFIGIALGIAGKFLSVEVDEKEVAIREALPGNNCGGCGYAGCDALAKAIAAGFIAVSVDLYGKEHDNQTILSEIIFGTRSFLGAVDRNCYSGSDSSVGKA